MPDDILRARVQTIGPEEHNLCIENGATTQSISTLELINIILLAIEGARDWKIYDVGGSRSQRGMLQVLFDSLNLSQIYWQLHGLNFLMMVVTPLFVQ